MAYIQPRSPFKQVKEADQEEQLPEAKLSYEETRKASMEARQAKIARRDSLIEAGRVKARERRAIGDIEEARVGALRARDHQRVLNIKGMTEEEYSEWKAKERKKKPQPSCPPGEPDFSSTKCGISKNAAREERINWKKKQ